METKVLSTSTLLGREFSVYGTAQEPLFKAKDVALMLGLSNQREFVKRVDEDEVRKLNLPGQSGETWMLTENGLYEVLMQSRKPIAKQFKRGVKQILKDIRNHGAYLTNEKIEEVLTDPDTLIRLAQDLKAERQKRIELEVQASKNKPKVLFAEAVTASHTSILVGELAKLLKQNGVDTGQNRLFQWLRQHGYLISRNGADYNMPTQRSMELGLFEIKETSISHSDGHISVTKTPKVTGKGQVYFINKMVKHGNI